MAILTVVPTYGYGWFQAGRSIDVPDPFNVVVLSLTSISDSHSDTRIYGKIDELKHPFSGKFALLTVRTLNPPRMYNVRVYRDKLASIEEVKTIEPFATGFAGLRE